jgi:hypothetical protein
MSQIVYGGDTVGTGLTLSYLTTRGIDFEPVKSDDGMDYRFTKISFDVSGVITSPLPPALMGETLMQTLARVEHYLNLPRRAFQYSVGGNPLVTWNGGPDLMNGPHPKGVRVRKVDGSDLLHVDFGVELNIITCPEGANPLWTSHRWSEEVTLDDTARTVKIRRGKIFARVDLGVNPDDLRFLVVPPIEPGFTRKESRYLIESSGMALEYQFTDREEFLMPPAPAFKAAGAWIESSANGASRFGEVRVQLKGAKGPNPAALVAVAIQVAMSKLRNDVQRQGSAFIAIGAIQQNLYEPEVSISVKALLKPLKDRFADLPINLERFNKFPLGSQQSSPAPDPGTRGTARLRLIAAALGDPCLSQTVIRAGGEGADQATLTGTVPEATVIYTTLIPTDRNALQNEQDPGIYETYEIRSRIDQDLNKIVMPVGKEGAQPVILQTASAVQTRVIEWKATKVGAPPTLPDPDLGDPNFVLLRPTFEAPQIEPYGDGLTLKYTVSGRYEYAVKDLTKAVLSASLPPWMDPAALPATMQAFSNFAKGIISPGPGAGGATMRTDGMIGFGGQSSLTTGLPNLENG